MSSISTRLLRVFIVALSLVYILLQFHFHRHHHHHHHSQPPSHYKKSAKREIRHKRQQRDGEKDKMMNETEGGAPSASKQEVAVGIFPPLPHDEEYGGQMLPQGQGHHSTHTIDWDDLYARGILTSHSCQVMSRNNNNNHNMDYNKNVTFLRAPDFILAGVQKAGTTALFALLGLHPQIVPSSHFEEHFFDMRYGGLTEKLRWGKQRQQQQGQQQLQQGQQQPQRLAGQALSCATAQTYVKRMDFAPQLAHKMQQQSQRQPQQHRFLTFEKTPNYILWPHIPRAIVQTCPWRSKIIMMLRDPVDRLYSHYQMYFVGQDEDDEGNGNGIASLEELLNGELRVLQQHGLVSSSTPPVPVPAVRVPPSNVSLSSSETTRRRRMMTMFQIPNITQRHRDQKDSINFRGFGNHGDYHRFLYRGMYYFQLARWLGRGGDDSVGVDDDGTTQQQSYNNNSYTLGKDLLVINYEHFKRETKSVMQQVYQFVGTDPTLPFPLTDAQLKAMYRPWLDYHNRQAAMDRPPAPQLAASTRRYLQDFYRPYSERLADLLGEEWRGVWGHGGP